MNNNDSVTITGLGDLWTHDTEPKHVQVTITCNGETYLAGVWQRHDATHKAGETWVRIITHNASGDLLPCSGDDYSGDLNGVILAAALFALEDSQERAAVNAAAVLSR